MHPILKGRLTSERAEELACAALLKIHFVYEKKPREIKKSYPLTVR